MSLWYLTGTVTLTSGSNDVTGVGSAWLANAKASDIFYTPSGGMYEILSVSANNALRLVAPYSGPSMAGVPYAIVSTQGFNVSLAMAMTELIPELAQIRDAYAAGADPASAAAAAAASANAAAAAALTAATQAASSAGAGSAINDATIAPTTSWSSTKTNAVVAALINDLTSASTTKTLSVTKINELITAAKTAVKNDLTGGAAAALDTLSELAQALNNDPAFATTISAALANRLRTDLATQGLSPTQRANAITNLGIADPLSRVLPPNGSIGQIPVVTANGYAWIDVPTSSSADPDIDAKRTATLSLLTTVSAFIRAQVISLDAL